MDKQEIFNKAFLGLKAQGFNQSITDTKKCLYRGPDGMKCAIGHIIPDELYKKNWDVKSKTVDFLPNTLWKKLGIDWLSNNMYQFLMALQRIHDNCRNPELMEARYREFARENNLSVPE